MVTVFDNRAVYVLACEILFCGLLPSGVIRTFLIEIVPAPALASYKVDTGLSWHGGQATPPATPSEDHTAGLCAVPFQHIVALAFLQVPHHCQVIP